ncbi:MAG: putative lipoprotein NlpC [Cyclobacteriaceae bacterium]|jgi:cell wall-associated NlpC family hydrolase
MSQKLLLFAFILFLSVSPSLAQKKKKIRQQKTYTVIKTAKTYMGTPYRYGGTSGKGIDCSGLMLRSFEKANYKLPRTAIEQSKFGKKVSKKRIKPGDIVFFKFKAKGKKSWYHSGLVTSVINDKPKFIHASSSRGVVESDLTKDYYWKSIKGFRRVIN